ncbi:MAG: hypothetical protein PCFJNLEI_00642 [Verrucomicrobiae bacterium]|nr:hypothetical protein [Verrucomicrobiae bacterium]
MKIILIFVALALSRSVVLARELEIAVAKTAPASATECFVGDLQQESGLLLRGRSREALAVGRYRLHVPLALAPFGDASISGVEIVIQAGAQTRTVGRLQFAEPDVFTDVPVDFVVSQPGKVPVKVTWSFQSRKSQRHRNQTQVPPTIDDSLVPEDETQLEGEGDLVPLTTARTRSKRLLGQEPYIELLSPLVVTSVQTDRVVYQPGQTGTVDVVVRNLGAVPVRAELTVECRHGLAAAQVLATTALDVPAGGSNSWRGPLILREMYWGAEIRAQTRLPDGRESGQSAVFAVATNFWQVALLAGQADNRGLTFKDPAHAEAQIRQWRAQGFTGFECFFWAECDFSGFTPQREDFFGGQTQYTHSISGTKNLIDAAHRCGMAATVYANLWGTDGAVGFETMRRHPEWIANGGFYTEVLDYWPGMYAKKIPPPHAWYYTNLVQDDTNSLAAIRYHAAQLVASHRQFGWDGVRYDSYFSNEWTKKATKLTRELVEREVPGFQFGYNSLIEADHRVGALDIMCSGGGMVMAEDIRQERSPSLQSYAQALIHWRDLVWPHNGHLGPLYTGHAVPEKTPATVATALDAVYVSAVMLATGSHPYYRALESDLGQHQRHALRYAEFIWDNRMRPVSQPEQVVTFGGMNPAPFLCWQPLVRKLNRGGDQRRIVIHLLNIPADYKFYSNHALQTPPLIRDLPVTVHLPADAQVTGSWSLCPLPESRHERLSDKTTNGTVTVRLPELRFFQTIVIDYTSREALP